MSPQDRQAWEFARLLSRAHAHRVEVRKQRVFIRQVIAGGDHEALEREWQALADLILEEKMLSHYLRAVFSS